MNNRFTEINLGEFRGVVIRRCESRVHEHELSAVLKISHAMKTSDDVVKSASHAMKTEVGVGFRQATTFTSLPDLASQTKIRKYNYISRQKAKTNIYYISIWDQDCNATTLTLNNSGVE